MKPFILTLWILTVSIGSCMSPLDTANKKPNIVVILTDDQGWGDLSVNGNSNLLTPNIDTLARDGITFDQFYVCQVCAPTRAEFLTGRYHTRGGVHGVTRGYERLNPEEKTIADTFKAAGYATAAFGKWHNGTQHPYHPNARGFDEFYGFCSGHWGNYFDPILEHNGRTVRGDGFIIDDLTNHALDFIRQSRNRPFFCYLAYNTPHSPMQVPDRFFEKFESAELGLRNRDPEKEYIAHSRAALAMCENIDWNVGRVLEKLGELDLANIPLVSTKALDGVNLSPLLFGTDANWPDRMIFSIKGVGRSNRLQVSVRTQQYRLDANGQLFDIGADPGQNYSLSGEKSKITGRLSAAAASWSEEVIPQVVLNRPFTVGYNASTPLPARDGVASGEIKRSARAPRTARFSHTGPMLGMS